MPEKIWCVAEVPKPTIATITKDAAHNPSLMAVINVIITKFLPKFVTTNCAAIVLFPKKLLFHLWRQSVLPLFVDLAYIGFVAR